MTTPDPTAGPSPTTVLDMLQASPVGPVLDMPVPLTPMEALGASPIGPLLNTPFTDIAAGALPPLPMLPPLPTLPPLPDLPQLPPLPGIDQLLQPVSDLASAFGTGTLGGFDPTAMLRDSSSVIDTALSMGISGLRALDQAWDGQAALAAQSQGEQARISGEQLSERGNAIAAVTQEAAATVSRGNTQLVAIAESFAATAVAAAPVALTPPGQTMLLAAAADHLQRALTVVAATRTELARHQSAMVTLGADIPVPVAPAPAAGLRAAGGQSPIAVAGAVLESVGRTLADSATQQTADTLASQTYAASVTPGSVREFAPAAATFGGGAALSGGSGTGLVPGFVAGGTGIAAGSIGRGPSAAPSPGAAVTNSTNTNAGVGAAATHGPGTPGGYAPTGMGSSAPRGAYDDSVHGGSGYLTAAVSSSEIVGDLPMVAPAVIGTVEIDALGGDDAAAL